MLPISLLIFIEFIMQILGDLLVDIRDYLSMLLSYSCQDMV
jgi:hypothetical protein